MTEQQLAQSVRDAAAALNVATSNAANAGLHVEYDLIPSVTLGQGASTYIAAKVTKDV